MARPRLGPAPLGAPRVLLLLLLLAAATALEILNVHVWRRWSYAEAMPVLPGLEIGLAPLVQWLAIPPLVLWLARRHLT